MGFQTSLELTLHLVVLIKILICALLEAVARSRKLKSKSGEADGEVIAAEIHLLFMDVNKYIWKRKAYMSYCRRPQEGIL